MFTAMRKKYFLLGSVCAMKRRAPQHTEKERIFVNPVAGYWLQPEYLP
jgi:hypothetical protein